MGGVAEGERGGYCRMVDFEGQLQSDVLPRPRGVVWAADCSAVGEHSQKFYISYFCMVHVRGH